MELKEYTKIAIEQIVSAIAEANVEISKNNAFIASSGVYSSGNIGISKVVIDDYTNRTVMNVEFDVAVEVSEQSNAGVGSHISIVVPLFKTEIGGKLQDASENKYMNRIKFSVPVALPEDQKVLNAILSDK